MRKYSTLLTISTILGIVIALFPDGATAGEYIADCEVGLSCSASISGFSAEIANTSLERITCTMTTGKSSFTSGSSTGSMELSFTGCREEITGFHFSCSNTTTAGKITTNTMTTHAVYLDPNHSEPGLLLTGMNMTFSCTGFSKKTVTGNLLGAYVLPGCGTFGGLHTIRFQSLGSGFQLNDQVTTSGTIFDLISNNDSGGSYSTTSLAAEITTSEEFGWMKLTC